jgi:hypothetical protein
MIAQDGQEMKPSAARPRASRGRVRDIVETRRHPTVVRLDHLEREDAGWIASAYCMTPEIATNLASLRRLLARPTGTGAFLIGQYGCGKSHFLAYVAQGIRSGTLIAEGPDVVALSLLDYRGETPLEDVVDRVLGIDQASPDRPSAWAKLDELHPRGVLLLIDELSEFLRSKPDRRRFNEDARFLQYLGEWADGHRLWVIAAMQEHIEHTGELEYGLYRKIRDRYPVRYLLTPAHVRDLVRDGILVKKEGYDAAVEELAAAIGESLPGSPLDLATFRGIYPVHPATLELLEEVRERFSQTRGVVDFVVTRLAGDPARGVGALLDEPLGAILTPDAIIDHFLDLFETQPEFLPLSQQVFPWYRKHLAEVFPEPALLSLAEQILKLLVLVHLSPRRGVLTANDASYWLLYRATRLDPERNLRIVERVLRTLAERGRFVVAEKGGYRLDLEDGGRGELERRLEREIADLAEQGEMAFEEIFPALEREEATPFGLEREIWQPRQSRWHFHERRYSVYLGREAARAPDGLALAIRLPWGDSSQVPGAYTLRPSPLALGREILELGALLRLRGERWVRRAAELLEARLRDRLTLLRNHLRSCYLDGEMIGPTGRREPAPRVDPSLPLDRWLEGLAEWMLRRTYPSFERFAPTHGPLPAEAYRAFLRFAAQGSLEEPSADEHVGLVREGYLVPMGLLRRKGRDYVIAPRTEGHELLRLLAPMIERQVEPRVVYERLAEPVYGLVPDQVSVLLIFLLARGDVDVLKAGRSLRELHAELPNPIQYDRIVPGRMLALEELRELEHLCDGLGLRVTALASVAGQRQVLRRLREIARVEGSRLDAFRAKLEASGEAEELADAVGVVASQWSALERTENELESFKQFLYEAGSARAFLSRFAALKDLPDRAERLLESRKRARHLLAHPALAEASDEELRRRVEALGDPPPVSSLEAGTEMLEHWLEQANALYRSYAETYRRRHDEWWSGRAEHPRLSWRPPEAARSRHLGLGPELERFEALRSRAQRLRCAGLADLDFQPVCGCGFDGDASPIGEVVAELESAAERIEEETRRFFAQPAVRDRIRRWVEEGLESSPTTLAYLAERSPTPEVRDVALLDRYLSGATLVVEADTAPVVELLTERTWEPPALLSALERLLARWQGKRVRFARPESRAAESSSEILGWCAEQALRFAVPLPRGLRIGSWTQVREQIRPEWVSPAALGRLEELGLGEEAEAQVLAWVVDGTIALPEASQISRSALVAAAAEVIRPSRPPSAEVLADLAARLYGQHARMMRVSPRWLERLEALARSSLPAEPPPLEEALARVLRDRPEATWLIVDALGAPLLAVFRRNLDALLPAWRFESVEFALAPAETTTDACYRRLIESGTVKRFEKIDAVDALLHERACDFDDFASLAMAELRVACRRLARRLEPGKSLVVFADHGFRLDGEGRRWVHGGSSTLERLVPVIGLVPR